MFFPGIHKGASAMFSKLLALFTVVVMLLIHIVSGSPGGGIHGGAAAPSREQRDIARKYARYATGAPPPFRKFCYPTEYKVQKRQAWLGEWMDPDGGAKSMLAFHSIGAGKTCAAIQVAERYRRPLVVLPASLIGGFRSELRSPCAGDRYCSAEWRDELKSLQPRAKRWREIIRDSDALIDAVYTIMSYNKFAESPPTGRHDIIIIDEVHNLANMAGSFYGAALDWIERHPASSVLLMSATPIFDSPTELRGLARLLRAGRPSSEETITPDDVRRMFAGHVSYFAGAPASTFPTADIRRVALRMSAHQAKWYRADVVTELSSRGSLITAEAANNFYSNTRQRANVAFPRGLTGEDGLAALSMADCRERIGVYSCKMEYLRRRLRKGKLAFIYTAYTSAAGIELIAKCMRAWGWRDYARDGPGRMRYVVWSGDTSDSMRDEIRSVYNSSDNDDASKIAVVIGSPAIREGVSMLRTRSAHLIDLYWNTPRIDQIMGRIIRFCSHKSLPADERNVRVYLYCAYAVGAAEKMQSDGVGPDVSIDAYMLGLADAKKIENGPYIEALKEIASDRLLN